jgi:serine/threonine protein kinase
MELCVGGELFDRIKEQGNYNERNASSVLRQIFLGLQYLHSHRVCLAMLLLNQIGTNQ